MRINDDKEQAARRRVQDDQIRRIVREEITRALHALDLAANDLDGYDTPELDSRAYSAGREVAQRAVTRLQQCWTEGHAFKSIWDKPLDTCRRCGAPVPEPVNPFEDEPVGRTRECPVNPNGCAPLIGWEAFCTHVYEVHTEGDEVQRYETADRLMRGLKTNGAS